MENEVKRVAIWGAGKGGSLLIPIIETSGISKVVIVVDKNPTAPGFSVAKKYNITTTISADCKAIIDRDDIDIIINTTGNDHCNESISALINKKQAKKKPELMTGLSAKLMWELIEQKQIHHDLYELGTEILKQDNVKDAAKLVVKKALELTDTKKANLLCVNESSRRMRPLYSEGFISFNVLDWKIRDTSVASQIIQEKEVFVVPDVKASPEYTTEVTTKEGIQSFIAIPILTANRLIGILFLNDTKPRKFTPESITKLKLLTTHSAYVLNKDLLVEELKKGKTRLEAINRISAVTATSLKVEEITQKGLENVLEVTGFQLGVVYILDKELLKQKASLGLNAAYLKGISTIKRKDIKLYDELINKGKPIPIPDVEKACNDGTVNARFFEGAGVGACIVVPLKSPVKTMLGIMIVGYKNKTTFSTDDIDMLEGFGNVIGVAVENALLHEKTETELEEEKDRLSRANAVISMEKYSANLQHDLKTPITGILGSSKYLIEMGYGTEDQRVKENLLAIQHCAEAAHNLMQKLLLPPGKVLERSNFALTTLIEESFHLIQTETKNLTISNDNQNGDITLYADKDKLKWTITNILSNACRAIKGKGEITVTTKKDDVAIKIIISDTGKGIPKEDQEKIFIPFVSENSTGLGLYYAKNAIEKHGGNITVESEVGKGATFTITLPIRENSK